MVRMYPAHLANRPSISVKSACMFDSASFDSASRFRSRFTSGSGLAVTCRVWDLKWRGSEVEGI